MHDLARAQRSVLLTLLAELHDAVVEEHPRVAAWLRHCMFPLTDGPEAFEVIADVEFDEWERSGDVQPLASLTPSRSTKDRESEFEALERCVRISSASPPTSEAERLRRTERTLRPAGASGAAGVEAAGGGGPPGSPTGHA